MENALQPLHIRHAHTYYLRIITYGVSRLGGLVVGPYVHPSYVVRIFFPQFQPSKASYIVPPTSLSFEPANSAMKIRLASPFKREHIQRVSIHFNSAERHRDLFSRCSQEFPLVRHGSVMRLCTGIMPVGPTDCVFVYIRNELSTTSAMP